MNNYQHHDRAQELADTHSAYELARRLVDLESARGEPVGYVLPSGIKQLNKDHPTDIYAPDNPIVPGSHRVWLYTAPPAPAADTECRRVLRELVDIGHIKDEQSLRDAKAALSSPPAPAAWADTYEALGRTDEPSFPAPASVPVDPWVLYDPETNQIKMDADTGCWFVFEDESQARRAMIGNPGTEYRQANWFKLSPPTQTARNE